MGDSGGMGDWTEGELTEKPHGHSPADRSHYLLDRLLDQNERLIEMLGEALRGQAPVEVIRALNPPFAPESAANPQVVPPNPWEADADPEATQRPLDPWADDSIPAEKVIPGLGQWVGIPGLDEAKAASEGLSGGETSAG